MTHAELDAVIREAAPLLAGSRVLGFGEVAPPAVRDALAGPSGQSEPRRRRAFVLLLESETLQRQVLRVVVSVTPDLAYLVVSPRRQPRIEEPSPFARAVDAALSGARLNGLTAVPGDRIAELSFEDQAGRTWTLTAQLFSRRPNLILYNQAKEAQQALARPGNPAPRPGRAETEAPRFAGAAGGSADGLFLNAAADAFFAGMEELRCFAELKSACAKRLARARKSAQKKSSAIEARLQEACRAEDIRRQGEILKAHYHLIRRGMDRFVPPQDQGDPAGPAASEAIPLDPALDPAKNLEAIFKRYRKLKRGVPPLQELLAQSRAELRALDAGERELAAASSAGDVAELAARLWPRPAGAGRPLRRGGPVQKKPSAAKKAAGRQAAGSGIRTFRSPDGLPLLVGRDGETNHRLLQAARGKDVWLHCHNSPGAHVVILVPKGKTAPLETLMAAALLAVHFSKRRGAGHADVIYTERRHVRAVKGAPKGTVTVDRFKTLHVKSDAEKLQSILETLET